MQKTTFRDKIEVNVKVTPLVLTIDELEPFSITLSARNRGKKKVDPQLARTQLTVNGQPSFSWSLTIGNGFREKAWSALPPGETVSMTWENMGTGLFEGPGEYELVFTYFDQAPISYTVEVREE